MEDKAILFESINEIHTTELGIERIRKSLKLGDIDVVGYCKDIIMNKNCIIYKQGKN